MLDIFIVLSVTEFSVIELKLGVIFKIGLSEVFIERGVF